MTLPSNIVSNTDCVNGFGEFKQETMHGTCWSRWFKLDSAMGYHLVSWSCCMCYKGWNGEYSPTIHDIYVYISIYLSIYLPACLSIDRSIHLSIHLSVDLSICIAVSLSVYLFIYRFLITLFVFTSSIHNFLWSCPMIS